MKKVPFLLFAFALAVVRLADASDLQTERLVALGKLWADARYFHPYLAYRDIDWDGALVRAIPKVKTATNQQEYAAAVQQMLDALQDPVTRVVQNESSLPPPENAEQVRKDGDILVVRFAGNRDFGATIAELRKATLSLSAMRGLVLDLRSAPYPGYLLGQSGMGQRLSKMPLSAPGQRTRMHNGLASPDATGSGGYYSAFQIISGPKFRPADEAVEIPVVFLVDSRSGIPDLALALQSAGKGMIVAEGGLSEDRTVQAQRRKMPDGVEAQLRLSELIRPDGTGGIAADLVVPAPQSGDKEDKALGAALALARNPKPVPAAPRPLLPVAGSAPIDEAYAGMTYPDAGYRLMAAFRIWSVFEYFFPYKDLMGEDWDAILTEFVPRMEAARNAEEYHLAVAEMLTHVHDSHVSVSSSVLNRYFGTAPTTAQLRWIENLPVVIGFYDETAAKEAGLEIGDIIFKVDGEDVKTRVDRLGKYIAASTPQSLLNRLAGRLLAGENGSTAVVTVRDRNGQIKDVKLARSSEYFKKAAALRSGEAFKFLSSEIGYADLTKLEVAQVETVFERFKATKAIIFDMRGYPNGTAWAIAPRLTEKLNVPAARFDWPLARNPGGLLEQGLAYSTETRFVQIIPYTDKWRYKGKTVMLIDERAISQSEHSGLFLQAANGTKFIGSPTAGANGDVTYFWAPGGIRIPFSGHSVRFADGRQLQRVGLKPDVEVRPTIDGVRAGKDEVLERALEYVRNSK